MKTTVFFLFGLVMSLSPLQEAKAQDGIVNAVSLRETPPIKSVDIQALDDSDENLLLRAEFIKELEANGYVISKSAEMILNFETRDQIGGWDSGSQAHVLSLEASGGRGGGENHKARVNVFDSSTGGLINRDQGARGSSLTASQYRLDLTLEARSDGKTYWRGWSVADLNSGEGLTLTKKMIPSLVQSLGKTVRSQTFSIE